MEAEPVEGDELDCPECDRSFEIQPGENWYDAWLRHRAFDCR